MKQAVSAAQEPGRFSKVGYFTCHHPVLRQAAAVGRISAETPSTY